MDLSQLADYWPLILKVMHKWGKRFLETKIDETSPLRILKYLNPSVWRLDLSVQLFPSYPRGKLFGWDVALSYLTMLNGLHICVLMNFVLHIFFFCE